MAEVLEDLTYDFRDKPIVKISGPSLSALDYHQVPIALASPANQEKLVDLACSGIGRKSVYAIAQAPYHKAFSHALATVYVREGVANKLAEVNRILTPYSVELLVWDGYRPLALQKELWNYFISKAKEVLPGAREEELDRFAGQYCSDPRQFDPSDYRTWPVHNSGGAIDLTLRRLADGQELFMGGIFDDADEISWTRHYEDERHTSESAREARRNR